MIDQLNWLEPELCVTVCLFYMNVARIVAFAAEKEKPIATNSKNFWHVQMSESLKRQALQTKFVSAGCLDQHARRMRYPNRNVSAGSRNGQASSLCSPELRQRETRCHFIRSNVFCKSCKSEAFPVFSRLLSIQFFSREFFVGLSFW
jgi:hypothetical protein